MRLLVFLHGTVIMHARAIDRAREEAGAQVRRRTDSSAVDFAAYVRVGGAVAKLRGWRVKSIVVPEFGGIDHFPHSVRALRTYEP